VCFVVKSNAYGHGLAETYQIMAPLGLRCLGVNTLAEAVALRRLGFRGSLLVLACLDVDRLAEAASDDIEYFVTNETVLHDWLKSPSKPRIHLKFNSGLNRQGFAPDHAEALATRLKPQRSLVVGVCTHFANVEDVSDTSFARGQIAVFERVAGVFSSQGYSLRRHMAASAAAMLLPASRGDFSRIGIALYGLWPSALTKLSYYAMHQSSAHVLHPVLSWRAPITNLLALKAGEFVGYGCTFKASQAMTLALLPLGYFEGFSRLAGEQKGSYVLIKGRRCPLVGRISMNMVVVDVSGISGLQVGEIATLLGRNGSEEISAEDHARWGQTISYEFVARLAASLPRRIV
jgi:alanine racemase